MKFKTEEVEKLYQEKMEEIKEQILALWYEEVCFQHSGTGVYRPINLQLYRK